QPLRPRPGRLHPRGLGGPRTEGPRHHGHVGPRGPGPLLRRPPLPRHVPPLPRDLLVPGLTTGPGRTPARSPRPGRGLTLARRRHNRARRLRPTRSLPLRRPTLSTGRLPLTGHAARLLSPCLTRSLALVRRSLSGRLTLTRRAARVRGTRLGRRLPLARRRGGARRLALTGGLAVVRRPNLRTRRPGRAGRTARLHSTRLGHGLALARRCSGARRLALASGLALARRLSLGRRGLAGRGARVHSTGSGRCLALARRRCHLAWCRGPGAGLVWRVRLSAG